MALFIKGGSMRDLNFQAEANVVNKKLFCRTIEANFIYIN